MQKQNQFVKDTYFIDEDCVVEGYDDGDEWNGFSCPFFEKDNITEWLKKSNVTFRFDDKLDAFVIPYSDDEDDGDDVYEGMDIEVDGTTVHVYSIGAYSWCWWKKGLDE